MSNVIIDREKIDILANAISDKSGVPVTMTLAEMVEAVDSIEAGGGEPNLQAKTYTVDSAGTETITADSGYDGLSEVEVSVPAGEVNVGRTAWFTTVSGERKWNFITLAQIELGDSYGAEGYIDDGYYTESPIITHNAIAENTHVTPTESSQTIGGKNTMMEGAVTVNAIPSNYVGSGITRRSSSDLTASGATVTVPSGYYSAQASKAVASGTAGTPTATKGTVSNHQVSVTPSVTNTSGYITGSTKTGTAVTVSASELVSGTKSISANGTGIDVTNYASVDVNVSGGGGGGTSKNTQVVQGTTRTTSSTQTAIGAEMTVTKTGTYDVYWSAVRSTTSASYTYGTQLFIDNVAYGTENTTWTNHVQNNHLSNVSLTANQKIRVRGRNSRGSSYYIYAPTLVIVEA